MIKIDEMGRLVSNLDSTVSRSVQKTRRMNKKSEENEKVGILLKEVQNMKNQMFFLQQSIIQLRTQVGYLVFYSIIVGLFRVIWPCSLGNRR